MLHDWQHQRRSKAVAKIRNGAADPVRASLGSAHVGFRLPRTLSPQRTGTLKTKSAATNVRISGRLFWSTVPGPAHRLRMASATCQRGTSERWPDPALAECTAAVLRSAASLGVSITCTFAIANGCENITPIKSRDELEKKS